MWLQRHRYAVAALLGGIAISLSLAPLHWWPLAFVGPGLIFWALHYTHTDTAKWVGWWSGLGLFGSGASWVYVSIHYHSDTPAVIAALMTFIFCGGLALLPAGMAWLYCSRLRHGSLAPLAFTALWVLFDALRGVILTGFPWLYIGTAHTDSPLAELMSILGANGLTAVTVLGASLMVQAIDSARRVPSLIAVCLLAVILAITPQVVDRGVSTIGERPLLIGIAQGNIDQEEKWKPENIRSTLSSYTALTEELWQSDIVVWPETAITVDYWRAASFLNAMHDIAQIEHTTLVTGIPYFDPEKNIFHNSITAVGKGEGLYHKQKLVPFGEYVPLANALRGTLAFFDLPMSSFDRGSAEQALLRAGAYTLAPFICYEVAYSEFVREQMRDANFIVTVSNDAWFGRSWAPWQHQQIAQVRAMETGRYVLRATNNGISSVIAANGEIIASTPQFERTTLLAEAWPMQGSTPYLRWGSAPLWWLCGVITLLQALLMRRRGATEN